MEEPCYKCGQMLEEGRVFCPHCRAPQIRVAVAEPVAAVAADNPLQPEQLPASETVPIIAVPMSWDQALQPCAIAALIAALGIVLKLIALPIALIGAGFLAVALYRRRNPEVALHARAGARVGAICGFLCFGITAILGALRVTILHESAQVWAEVGQIRADLLKSLQQRAGSYSAQQLQASLDFVRSPTGLVVMLVGLAIFTLILFILMGMLGGALGGVGMGRRDRS
jgi:hypothetical protein